MTRIGRVRAVGRIAALATLIGSLLTPLAAQAEFEPGWYIGGGIGTYSVTEADPGFSPQLRDANAIGTQIFGGYQFKFVAVEAGYMFLNDLIGTDAGIEIRDHLDGWFGRGLLMFPIEYSPTTSVAIFGGGGAHNWKERVTITDKVAGIKLADATGSGTGASVTAGVWIRGRRAATRIAYELLTFDDTDNEISLWSISMIYHF